MRASQATKVRERPARSARKTLAGGTAPGKPLSHKEYMAQFYVQKRSFFAQRKRLMKEHPESLYVAIWHGTPVVFGQTFIDVAVEFDNSFGDDAVYIGKLSDEQDEEVIGGVILQ